MRRSKAFRIAMIPTANAGVNYYRLANFAWKMRKHRNVEVAVYSYHSKMVNPHPWQFDMLTNPIIRREIDNLCSVADIVVWQPCFYSHSLEFFMDLRARHEKPMLLETDDNYIDVPTWNEAFRTFTPHSNVRHIATEHMKLADGIIVSTPFLAELYRQFNLQTTVVQNSIDFDVWDKVGTRKHRGVRVGWIGGRTHIQDILNIVEPVKQVLRRCPNVWLYLINSGLAHHGNHFKGESRVYYSDRSAPINLYPRFMAHFNFDIGLAPLEDCNFNRGKSNLRWLEYSALSIPTVATKIGHFAATIEDGKDGILIPNNDPQHWEDAITHLVKEKDERNKLGRAAHARIRKDFNARKTAAAYLRILRDIAGYSMGATDDGGAGEPDAALYSNRGPDQRPEPRPLHYIAD